MRTRRNTLILVTALACVTIVPSADAALKTRRFKTPGAEVVCHLGFGSLRCDVKGGLDPEPKKECELDWVGLLLPRHATAKPNCAGDTVGTAKRVLDYGEKWKRGGRVCESKRSGLHCWNEDGYHFKLSDDDWKRWH
ncbi:MAG TPA: hypothetical protein VG318_18195 [Actinomycetota bacterium]|nr:hypothetical protein [Actinomycetota bacterium]